MRLGLKLFACWCLALSGASAQGSSSQCDTKDYACHDVMNSSQCLAQLIYDKNAKVTKEALIKCLDTEGSASPLSAATRVSQGLIETLCLRTPADKTVMTTSFADVQAVIPHQ